MVAQVELQDSQVQEVLRMSAASSAPLTQEQSFCHLRQELLPRSVGQEATRALQALVALAVGVLLVALVAPEQRVLLVVLHMPEDLWEIISVLFETLHMQLVLCSQ